MQYRRPHPWDPGYAIPEYVMAEPPLRGTYTSKGIPRKTIDAPAIPPPWRTGYAYPDYVGEEPLGRGVYRTKYLPRKSTDVVVPQAVGGIAGFAEGNPIASFGEKVADYILGTIKSVPAGQRQRALRQVFDEIDPKLWSRVNAKATQLQKAGMPTQSALRQAIADAAAKGLLEEFVKVGKTGKIKPKSMSGLAAYGLAGYESLGFGWGDLNPLKWVAKGTARVTETVAPGVSKVGDWGKSVLEKVGDLACGVASSKYGQIAASAGAASAGGTPQVGAQGAQMVAAACSSGPTTLPPQSTSSSWLLPVVVGGAGLLAIVLLTRK